PRLRAHPGPLLRLPVAERAEHRLLGLPRDVVHAQRAGELDRPPHLLDVRRAAVASGKVGVDALPLAGGQIALEGRGHELDELTTVQMGEADAHCSSDRYC